MPVLPLLAGPIVEKLRVAQGEIVQEGAASQSCRLLKLRLQCATRFVGKRFLGLLAGNFNDVQVQQECVALIECQRIAFDQQVGLLSAL